MNKFKHAIFLLIFSICNHAYALDSTNRSIKAVAGKKKIACPSRDFSRFIKVFSENVEVQMAFTKYPLQEQIVDTRAEPEPETVERELRRDQVSFPIMPNEAERKEVPLIFRIDENKPTHAKLTIFKDDSDAYQISYFFSRNSCWRLERIEDSSLVNHFPMEYAD